MKDIKKITPVVVLFLCVAGMAWASDSKSSQADAKACPYKAETKAQTNACPYQPRAAHATLTGAGTHCDGVGKSADVEAHQCGVKAGQAIYSFAVPGAECDHCIRGIQKATMAMKGIHCAHVDLSTHTAYIIADKGMSRKAITKCIEEAGFKNSYKGTGTKVEAEFVKAMKTGTKNGMSCCPAGKEKDKV